MRFATSYEMKHRLPAVSPEVNTFASPPDRLDPVQRYLVSTLRLSGMGVLYTGDTFPDGDPTSAFRAAEPQRRVCMPAIGGRLALALRQLRHRFGRIKCIRV
jgi:hypothetical protein